MSRESQSPLHLLKTPPDEAERENQLRLGSAKRSSEEWTNAPTLGLPQLNSAKMNNFASLACVRPSSYMISLSILMYPAVKGVDPRPGWRCPCLNDASCEDELYVPPNRITNPFLSRRWHELRCLAPWITTSDSAQPNWATLYTSKKCGRRTNAKPL